MATQKCVIDWLTGAAQLEVLNLAAWKHRIGEMRGYFQEIKFQHIYREFNKYADRLSKSALSLDPRHILIEELVGSLIQCIYHLSLDTWINSQSPSK